MPSLPSSSVPTATACPLRTLRGSVATRSPPPWRTMTQSIRGRRGRDHAPAALTYVGRLVVEKKPSGRTPSAGAGSKRASGATLSGGASKLGGRYWNRGRVVTGTLIIRAANPVTQRPALLERSAKPGNGDKPRPLLLASQR